MHQSEPPHHWNELGVEVQEAQVLSIQSWQIRNHVMNAN